MKIYFSQATKGFYHEGLQSSLPPDAVEINEKQYETFQANVMKGLIGEIVDGDFIFSQQDSLVSAIPPADSERLWRNVELTRADIELYKVQDSDPEYSGTVADWRNYRRVLRAWPEHEDFPNKESRPVSPLIKEY